MTRVVAVLLVLAVLAVGGLVLTKRGPFGADSADQETATADSAADTADTADTAAESTVIQTTPPTTAGQPTAAPETAIAETDTPTPVSEVIPTSRGDAVSSPPVTAATPDAAVKTQLPEGWVLRKISEGPKQVEFWAGPPNSEFTTVYLVDAQPGGGWRVSEVHPLDPGGDVGPENEAVAVVEQFERYIQANEAMKAHDLTVEPFASDAASAQFSNGEFLTFEVKGVEDAGDGTYYVTVAETWKNASYTWVFRVKRTAGGMKIFELILPTQ